MSRYRNQTMQLEEAIQFETALIKFNSEQTRILYHSLDTPVDLPIIDQEYFDNLHILSDAARDLFSRLGIDPGKLYNYSPGNLLDFDIDDKTRLYIVTYHFFGEFVSGGIKQEAIVKYEVDLADTFYDSKAFPEKIQFAHKFPNIYFPSSIGKPQMELIIQVPMPVFD